MSTAKNKLSKELEEKLETSSINLVKLDDRKLPTQGHGSGCLLDFGKYRYLLTVTHNIGDGKKELQVPIKWDVVVTDSVKPIGKELVTLTAGTAFEGMKDPLDVMEDIDFSYCRYSFDEVPLFNKIDRDTEKVLATRPCTIFSEASVERPEEGKLYGFAGHTRAAVVKDELSAEERFLRLSEFRVASNLRFIGEEKTQYGLQYTFELPLGHPTDDKSFKGCSGTPIVDEQGKVVALVSCGSLSRSRIYGVPIKNYIAAILVDSLDLLPQ